jgi:protein TonB
MVFHPRRALALALAASLLAHAALLFGVAWERPARFAAPAMAIEVLALNRASAQDAPAAGKAPLEERSPPRAGNAPQPAAIEETPPPRAEPPKPVRRKTVLPRTKDILTRKSEPAAAPFSPPAPEAAPAAAAPAEPAVIAAGAAGGAAGEAAIPRPGVSSVPGSAPGDETAAGDLGRYRSALAASARRFKRYPPLARERGWEGSVVVSLEFHRLDGPVFSLAVSSGKEILDEQALETFRRAVRQVDLPESLKGRDFRIRQEFVFHLEDEE